MQHHIDSIVLQIYSWFQKNFALAMLKWILKWMVGCWRNEKDAITRLIQLTLYHVPGAHMEFHSLCTPACIHVYTAQVKGINVLAYSKWSMWGCKGPSAPTVFVACSTDRLYLVYIEKRWCREHGENCIEYGNWSIVRVVYRHEVKPQGIVAWWLHGLPLADCSRATERE